jgi:hypothetical protein
MLAAKQQLSNMFLHRSQLIDSREIKALHPSRKLWNGTGISAFFEDSQCEARDSVLEFSLFYPLNRGGSGIWRIIANTKCVYGCAGCGEQMKISEAALFSKQLKCPSAEDLIAYGRDLLVTNRREFVWSHLRECDFCCAELQLLSELNLAEQQAECLEVEIPLHLRLLAESILAAERGTLEPNSDARVEIKSYWFTDN